MHTVYYRVHVKGPQGAGAANLSFSVTYCPEEEGPPVPEFAAPSTIIVSLATALFVLAKRKFK